MRPLPSDSTTQIVPVSAMPKFAPLTPPPAPTGTSRAGAGAPPRRSRSPRQPSSSPSAIVRSNSAPDLGAVAVDRRHEDVRLLVARRAGRSARPGRSRSRAMPARGERLVEPDLVGGQRLDLDHLVAAVGRARSRRRSRSPRRRRAPSARCRPPRVTDCLEALELLGQRRHRARLDRRAGVAQLLPVGQLGDRAQRAWRGSSCVALPRLRRSCASPSASRAAAGKPLLTPVAARISARCIVRTPARWRRSAAADVHQARVVGGRADLGARVEDPPQLVREHRHRRVGVLDREGAAEAAALLGLRRARRGRCPATASQQPPRPVADLQQPQRVARRVQRHAVRERRADVDRRRAGRRGTRSARTRRPSAAGQWSRTIADARRRRRDDRLVAGEHALEAVAPARARRSA